MKVKTTNGLAGKASRWSCWSTDQRFSTRNESFSIEKLLTTDTRRHRHRSSGTARSASRKDIRNSASKPLVLCSFVPLKFELFFFPECSTIQSSCFVKISNPNWQNRTYMFTSRVGCSNKDWGNFVRIINGAVFHVGGDNSLRL